MHNDRSPLRVVPFPRSIGQPVRSRHISGLHVLLLIAALSAALPFAAIMYPTRAVAQRSDVQTASGMTVYIGLIPAAIIKQHPEVMMHGGKPSGVNEFHLTVAVFDAANGERISDATVTAAVAEVGLAGEARTLEHMQIAGMTTYGEFVSMRPMAHYDIRITVTRHGQEPVTFDFPYDRPHQ